MPGISTLTSAVQQVLDHHHGVVALLDGLRVEVRGQLGQVVIVEMHGDRDVLLRRGEFVTNLVLHQGAEFGVGAVTWLMERDNTAGRRALSSKASLTQERFS